MRTIAVAFILSAGIVFAAPVLDGHALRFLLLDTGDPNNPNEGEDPLWNRIVLADEFVTGSIDTPIYSNSMIDVYATGNTLRTEFKQFYEGGTQLATGWLSSILFIPADAGFYLSSCCARASDLRGNYKYSRYTTPRSPGTFVWPDYIGLYSPGAVDVLTMTLVEGRPPDIYGVPEPSTLSMVTLGIGLAAAIFATNGARRAFEEKLFFDPHRAGNVDDIP